MRNGPVRAVFNGLPKWHCRGKPLKRLKNPRQAMSTGLKPSVNESDDSINPLDKSREALQIPQHLNELPLWSALSRIRIRPEFRSASAPILERRAGCNLKVIVAGLAPDVILPVIAAAFAAPLPVNEPHFSRVIDLIQRRTDHLTRQIFSIHHRVLGSRIRSGAWSPRRRGPDIARSQIRHRKQAERRHPDLSQRGFVRQLRTV